jgi:DNA-binding GntR family transcriptional regulator
VEHAPLTPAQNAAAHGYLSKTDMVAALIRELIITGDLPAGEPLRQRDLARRFEVSQTPVREAMRRLESEGLVTGGAHRGFTVSQADAGPAEAGDQIRVTLEGLAASLAATRIDEAGVDRLQQLNDQIQTLPDSDPQFPLLNREFHFAIYEHAHSPLLMAVMRLLWASQHGILGRPQTRAQSARQHDDLLEALRRKDPAAASRTYEHIVGAGPGRPEADGAAAIPAPAGPGPVLGHLLG